MSWNESEIAKSESDENQDEDEYFEIRADLQGDHSNGHSNMGNVKATQETVNVIQHVGHYPFTMPRGNEIRAEQSANQGQYPTTTTTTTSTTTVIPSITTTSRYEYWRKFLQTSTVKPVIVTTTTTTMSPSTSTTMFDELSELIDEIDESPVKASQSNGQERPREYNNGRFKQRYDENDIKPVVVDQEDDVKAVVMEFDEDEFTWGRDMKQRKKGKEEREQKQERKEDRTRLDLPR